MLNKSAVFVLALLCVTATVAQSASGSGKPQTAAHNNACINATSAQDGIGLHTFPGSSKKMYSYNVDIKPRSGHKAMCVSASKLDSVLWHHGDGTSCFKVEPKLISEKNADGKACPAYPFTRPLPDTCMDQHHSEHAKKEAIGCSYDMVFHREDGSSTDPHIVVGK